MIIFYLLTIFASLPIIAYVLAQKTSNKGLIFGSTIIAMTFCLVIFISKFALIGSVQKQNINNKIFDQIYVDSKISSQYLKEIEEILEDQELKNWLIALITKSIDLKKLNSAESLIAYSENFFTTSNEKIVFYGLYTLLRDQKFPDFQDSSFAIDSNSKSPCLIKDGKINLFIMNGPEIPIATKEFKNIQDIKITNSDSMIPGFDLASAKLNQETIEFNIEITCLEDNKNFYLKNLVVLDNNRTHNTYKINLNEWLKDSQEL